MNKRTYKTKTIKNKYRMPKSTRSSQVHKSIKDYDRKDESWKKELI